MAHNSLGWSETLSPVLLGLCTAIQEYSAYTIAQMVYGQGIRLHGEIFHEISNTTPPDNFARQIKKVREEVGPGTVSKTVCPKSVFSRRFKNHFACVYSQRQSEKGTGNHIRKSHSTPRKKCKIFHIQNQRQSCHCVY